MPVKREGASSSPLNFQVRPKTSTGSSTDPEKSGPECDNAMKKPTMKKLLLEYCICHYLIAGVWIVTGWTKNSTPKPKLEGKAAFFKIF